VPSSGRHPSEPEPGPRRHQSDEIQVLRHLDLRIGQNFPVEKRSAANPSIMPDNVARRQKIYEILSSRENISRLS
jgi:hypothetical protein